MALDDATTALLTQLAESGTPPLHEMSPDQARGLTAALGEMYGPGMLMERVEDTRIDVPGGTIGLRILVPPGTVRGVVVYDHGGGWVIGALDEFDTLGRELAARTGCVVVLVDYRLAPEHRFPTAVDDAWAALRWVDERVEELAGARVPLIVAGDSAGGNLAAVTARRARDAGGPEIALQVLVYPVTDADTGTASYRDPENQLLLSRDAMVWFWDHYAPDAASRRDPDAAPLRAEDLSGLPPAVVLTAEHDPLRDEGEAYAAALEAAGVPVEHRRFDGQMHGFFTMVNVLPGSALGLDMVVEAIDRATAGTAGGRPGSSPEGDPDGGRVDAVVVGAGLAGLYQLHRLRGLGLRARVIEAADGVGGTWYWNRYPGARCDVESMEYSYSFDPELEQDWEWSEKYPTQPEILRYVEHVADRYDLRRDITVGTRVEAAHYDDDAQRWTVRTDGGETIDARFLVMATGCLSSWKTPDVPGRDTFAGRTFETGHWPHEGVDFTGRRVAVIGTGSSGIQSIPLIAEQAGDLTVFQRTPNFSMPAGNRPLTADEVADMKARYPEHREAARQSAFGVPVEHATQSALEVTDQERRATYESAWQRGNLVAVLGSYTDTLVDADANETAAEFVRSKIREVVDDPEIAERLAPDDHPYGTKRPCLDTGYYATFNADHVHLVDVRSTPIEEITPEGVRTSAGLHAVDDLVFATGFDAMTGALAAIDVRGRDGTALVDRWSEGPKTYLGLAVAGFPNLFLVTGPGSPSVLSNMVVSIEQHVDWITDAVAAVLAEDARTIEATERAQEEWVAHVNEVAHATLFPTANSWYLGANVPGKPRVFMPYAGGVGPYRAICDEVAAEGYRGFVVSGPGGEAVVPTPRPAPSGTPSGTPSGALADAG